MASRDEVTDEDPGNSEGDVQLCGDLGHRGRGGTELDDPALQVSLWPGGFTTGRQHLECGLDGYVDHRLSASGRQRIGPDQAWSDRLLAYVWRHRLPRHRGPGSRVDHLTDAVDEHG